MPVQYLNKMSGIEQVSDGEFDDPLKTYFRFNIPGGKLVFLPMMKTKTGGKKMF